MARMKSSAPRGGSFSLQGCLGRWARGVHGKPEALACMWLPKDPSLGSLTINWKWKPTQPQAVLGLAKNKTGTALGMYPAGLILLQILPPSVLVGRGKGQRTHRDLGF